MAKLIIDLIFTILMFGMCVYMSIILYTCAWWELPYVPTMRTGKKALAKYLKLKKSDTIMDFGSGLGSMLLFFARYPVKVIGIEKRRLFVWWSKVRKLLHPWKSGRIEVRQGDFFQTDISKATYIYCFHIPKLIKNLVVKFEKELTEKQTLISYKFPYPLSEDFKVETVEDEPGSCFYVYKRK